MTLLRQEIARTSWVNDYTVKYDFSGFTLLKRIRMAMAIILEGGFMITGNVKNKLEVNS